MPAQSLFGVRSATAEAAMAWLRAMANALDPTDLFFNGDRIRGSATAVDAFVYTKRMKNRDLGSKGKDDGRATSETSLIDQTVAHLYEQAHDWDDREKRRWCLLIRQSRVRLGVKGSPGSGKTFLTRTYVVRMARESESLVKDRAVHLNDLAIPFWTAAKTLASVTARDPAEAIVDAFIASVQAAAERIGLPKPHAPREWLIQREVPHGAFCG